MGELLIIGSTCVDVIIHLPHLPQTGEDLQPENQTFSVGGCGWNVYRAARLSGACPVFLSPVGTGIYSEMVNRAFSAKGVPVFARAKEANGCCYCLVEPGGERTFLSVRGAEYRITREMLEALSGEYDFAYICGMELQEPTADETLEWLKEHPKTGVFYAPGPQGILLEEARQNRIFSLRPILHLNEPEANALSGASDPETAAKRLWRRTGNLVVITLGEKGCFACTAEGKQIFVPAFPVTVADTIGAGDTHAGMLLGCLYQGMELEAALKYANRASALVVSRQGADVPENWEGI